MTIRRIFDLYDDRAEVYTETHSSDGAEPRVYLEGHDTGLETTSLAFSPEQARTLASALIDAAAEAEG